MCQERIDLKSKIWPANIYVRHSCTENKNQSRIFNNVATPNSGFCADGKFVRAVVVLLN